MPLARPTAYEALIGLGFGTTILKIVINLAILQPISMYIGPIQWRNIIICLGGIFRIAWNSLVEIEIRLVALLVFRTTAPSSLRSPFLDFIVLDTDAPLLFLLCRPVIDRMWLMRQFQSKL